MVLLSPLSDNTNDHNDEGTVKTIDGHVASNNELREISGRAWLIGGRPHPVHLEFFTYKEEKALIELKWKPPHGSLQTIPQHYVSPDRVHESFVVEAYCRPEGMLRPAATVAAPELWVPLRGRIQAEVDGVSGESLGRGAVCQ